MTEALKWFINRIVDVVSLLERLQFNIYGINISFFWFLVAFIIVCFVVSVFWKGAKM